MAHPALLASLPRSLTYRRKNYTLFKDRHLRDTLTVGAATTSQRFFETTSAKQPSEANFYGDLSLVREDNIFLVLQLHAYVRSRILERAELQTFFGFGSYSWRITKPTDEVVSEENLSIIAPGPDCHRVVDSSVAAVDEAQAPSPYTRADL